MIYYSFILIAVISTCTYGNDAPRSSGDGLASAGSATVLEANMDVATVTEVIEAHGGLSTRISWYDPSTSKTQDGTVISRGTVSFNMPDGTTLVAVYEQKAGTRLPGKVLYYKVLTIVEHIYYKPRWSGITASSVDLQFFQRRLKKLDSSSALIVLLVLSILSNLVLAWKLYSSRPKGAEKGSGVFSHE